MPADYEAGMLRKDLPKSADAPAPSYCGRTVVGVCPDCNHRANVTTEAFSKTGMCTGCNNIVEWEYWDGPVGPVIR